MLKKKRNVKGLQDDYRNSKSIPLRILIRDITLLQRTNAYLKSFLHETNMKPM